MHRILFVDDEPFLLSALRRSLRSKRGEWETHFLEDGREAFRIMDECPVDALVTDMRMPNMTGTELIGQVVANRYDTVRILLTGQSEQRSILPCLGLVHRFLTKPCEPRLLVETLDELLATRMRIEANELRSALTNLECLPIESEKRQAFEAELNSQVPDTESLGMVASSDVGMTVRLLQFTHSSILATDRVDVYPRSMVESIGVETLKQLYMTGHLFPTQEIAANEFDLRALNDRSVRLAMNLGAKEKDESHVNTTWLSGMLSEVGTLALAAVSSHVSQETVSRKDIAEYLLALWAPGVKIPNLDPSHDVTCV